MIIMIIIVTNNTTEVIGEHCYGVRAGLCLCYRD